MARLTMPRRNSPSRAPSAYSNWTVSEDPEEHARAIERYYEAGVTDVFVHSGQEDQARVIDFFGAKVLPLLRR
jgi:alkanesulfonate monooxygenase SsuD/methylene tetrahydromethanopterin reductase-like flavin-dependent oxidoreductase (luciferase family)